MSPVHSPPWRREAVLRRHKTLTKYCLLWPMKAHAKWVATWGQPTGRGG